MSAILRVLKWTILGVTGLFLAVVVALFFLVDPNDYKDDIIKLARDNAGIELAIDGPIRWNFYPAIGFSVEGLGVAMQPGAAPVAAVGKAGVSVQLLPLFSRQVNVQTLFVDGLKATLVVDENGKGNWEMAPAAEAPAVEEAPAETPVAPMPVISVPQVVITNSSIDYQDKVAGSHYTVTINEFVAEDVSLDNDIPFKLIAALDDNAGMKVALDLRAFTALDLDKKVYGLREMELVSDVTGILDAPLRATLAGDLSADLANDTATVGPLRFGVASLQGILNANATALSTEPVVTGHLSVPAFNAKDLMRQLSIKPPVTADDIVLTKVGVETDLRATTKDAALDNLVITLDDSKVAGSVAVTDLAKSALRFALAVDSINADRYLPPVKEPKEKAGKEKKKLTAEEKAARKAEREAKRAARATEPILPVEMLRTLDVEGQLTVGALTLMEQAMTGVEAGVRARDGIITIDPLRMKLLDGSIAGTTGIDVRGEQPVIAGKLALDRVDVGPLVHRFSGEDLFAGRTSLKLDFGATGNTTDALTKSATGKLDMNFDESTLKGLNLTNMLNQSLSTQLGAFSMLVPDYQQKLPQQMKEDTVFQALGAKASLENGKARVKDLQAASGGNTISGGGEFDIATFDFDYGLSMTTDALKDNRYFANASFPVRCNGNVADPVADWCGVDGAALKGMLETAAKKAVGDRVGGELGSKLGIDTGGDVKGAAKKEAKKRIEAEKDKAEQKAKEGLQQSVDDALKKYL